MPAKRRSYVAVVKAAERALRAAKIRHVFVGALSVNAFGVPRTTHDVDVIAEYRMEDVPTLVLEFRQAGFRVSLEDLRDSLKDGSHCTVDDTHSEFRVDLAPSVGGSRKDAVGQGVPVRWRGVSLPISSPEHTIVMKLVFGSEQDLEDALGIYVRQRERLDFRRMKAFARERGVIPALDLLERKAKDLVDRNHARRRSPSHHE